MARAHSHAAGELAELHGYGARLGGAPERRTAGRMPDAHREAYRGGTVPGPEPATHLLPLGLPRNGSWVAATHLLPPKVARHWRILPYHTPAGQLVIAGPELPCDELAEDLRRYTAAEATFHLVTQRCPSCTCAQLSWKWRYSPFLGDGAAPWKRLFDAAEK